MLLGFETARRSTAKMDSLNDIADTKGRLNYEALKRLVSSISIPEFTEMAQHPFLVGKELYDGELMKGSNMTSTSTLCFSPSELRRSTQTEPLAVRGGTPTPPPEGSSLAHAIYMLRKRPFSADPQNVISIGRAASNDMVVADYVVSKRHSQIILFKGLYFIVDCNSTNGTRVNLQPITPGMKVQLQENFSISFGRLAFVFTSPMSLYRGLRKEMLGT